MVGKTLAKARTRIRAAHCRVGNVTRKASSNRLKGKVIKQSPRAGKHLKAGSKVKLTVGK